MVFPQLPERTDILPVHLKDDTPSSKTLSTMILQWSDKLDYRDIMWFEPRAPDSELFYIHSMVVSIGFKDQYIISISNSPWEDDGELPS